MERQADYSEIISRYEKILKDFPHSCLFVPLANAYIETGTPEKAIAVAKEGLMMYPDYAGAKMVLAKAYSQCQRMEEARKECLKVLESYPDNLLAYRFLLDIYLYENNKKEAVHLMNRLKDVLGKDMNLREFVLSLEAKLDEFDRKEPVPYKKAGSKQALSDINTETLARLYEEQGLLDQAIATYKKVLKDRPDDEAIRTKIQELEKQQDEEMPEIEEEPEIIPLEENDDETLENVIDDQESLKEIRNLFPSILKEEKEEESSYPSQDKKVIQTLENWMKNIESTKKNNP
jgi:tetratricopeptide (TPR) repeat protein